LPESVFRLEYVGTEDEYEGPWDPRWAEIQPDGSVALLSDGHPIVLKVTHQRGDRITLDDGTQMRIVEVGDDVRGRTFLS
jgi:hypothetical protein